MHVVYIVHVISILSRLKARINPNDRRRLNAAEEVMKRMKEHEYFALTQHLRELGCPLDLNNGYRDTPAGLKFRQILPSGANCVFDLDDSGSGYIMDMRFSSELNLPMRIRRVKLRTPWGLRDIALLPDPSKRARGYECYDFPGGGPAFHRDAVINDFLSGKGTLSSGGEIEGLLLAVDEKPIPDEYPEHGQTEVELSITDERGNTFSSKFKLCVDRGATFSRERKIKTSALSRARVDIRRVRDAA
jgi:hypothetical protein